MPEIPKCIDHVRYCCKALVEYNLPVVVADRPELHCYRWIRYQSKGGNQHNSLASPSSLSIQMDRIFESELHPTSLTLYPHFRSLPTAFASSVQIPPTWNSLRLSPFSSNITKSWRPSRAAPPPGNPHRGILTIQLPAGRHARTCSSSGVGSDMRRGRPSRAAAVGEGRARRGRRRRRRPASLSAEARRRRGCCR